MLLRGAEQIVEEGDVELEDLDELDDAAVGDVELAVEVEGARVGVRAVLGDLAVVDVARELGRVLVLLVLGLEGADADAVLLAEHEAAHADVLHHLRPVAAVLLHQLVEDEAAGRIELALDLDVELRAGEAKLLDRALAPGERDEAQRLLVHRALEVRALRAGHADVVEVGPVEGVERAVRRARVVLDPLLQQARDRGLRRADGAVKEDDALLRPVAFGGGLEDVDEAHQGDVEPVDRVGSAVLLVLEEVVANELLLVVRVLLDAVPDDHVVRALERVARDLRVLPDDLEVVLEGALPGKIAVEREVLHRRDLLDHRCPNLDHRGTFFEHGAPFASSMARLEIERACRGNRSLHHRSGRGDHR